METLSFITQTSVCSVQLGAVLSPQAVAIRRPRESPQLKQIIQEPSTWYHCNDEATLMVQHWTTQQKHTIVQQQQQQHLCIFTGHLSSCLIVDVRMLWQAKRNNMFLRYCAIQIRDFGSTLAVITELTNRADLSPFQLQTQDSKRMYCSNQNAATYQDRQNIMGKLRQVKRRQCQHSPPPRHTPALQAKFRTFTDMRIKVLSARAQVSPLLCPQNTAYAHNLFDICLKQLVSCYGSSMAATFNAETKWIKTNPPVFQRNSNNWGLVDNNWAA